MRRFLVIVEKRDGAYSAYTPDLPGCAAAGASIEEAEQAIHAALRLHVEAMEAENLPVSNSASLAEYLLV